MFNVTIFSRHCQAFLCLALVSCVSAGFLGGGGGGGGGGWNSGGGGGGWNGGGGGGYSSGPDQIVHVIEEQVNITSYQC